MLVLFKWLKLFFDISIVMPLTIPMGGGEFPDNKVVEENTLHYHMM